MPKRRARWVRAVLVSLICLWSASLVIQNVAIILVAKQEGSPPYPLQLKIILVVATAKAIMIALALLYFLRQPRRRSAVILGVVVLFAFPLGLFIDPTFRPEGQSADPRLLITLSALLSYATVAAIFALQILRERAVAAQDGNSLDLE